jgi:riboflavin kinase, archaea type
LPKVSPLNTITLNGKVVSGEGNGKKYLSLPWVKKQIEEKLGFTPYLGTLNLQLSTGSVTQRKLLEKTNALTILPPQGYCVGIVFKACISKTECGIVIPQVKNYPQSLLEIIAPENLREKFRLTDGKNVAVTINF